MKISVREMSLVAMFAGLTAVGAMVSIPFGEVPITMQTLFVILSGLILGPKLGPLSQIVYVLLGLAGAPIFAGFTGGLQSIMAPSFGFIISFIFVSYIAGLISHCGKSSSKINIWIGSFVGTIVAYLIGLPYMYYILNIVMGKGLSFGTILNMGCILFLPGDLFKFIIASVATAKILPILKKSGLSLN
ncbi:biotin transporter BioY [Tissierella pigra]|uniref:Biotin transporter n=1 Tax=Tissierella pigra TaxID=2607614 RepID=A0A6N7Y0S5_9FIRM|nr:biotin transporter BioY [Tissierella pigra]MBU5425263.1 biotin transporter BioY [Tissierella pigra]MSU02098.1 biotin transporter BioY [Tissierella pigra]